MTELHAKPIIQDKFWIIEKDGENFATLTNDNNQFIMSGKSGVKLFNNKASLTKQFGKDFFVVNIIKEATYANAYEVHGYPTKTIPCNPMFDVTRRLPLYTKSSNSKSFFCAGYYLVLFNKGWLKGYCPKLATLQEHKYIGPFYTKKDMNKEYHNVTHHISDYTANY